MKILLFANTSWNLFNYRFHLIETLISAGHDVQLLSPEDEYTSSLLAAGFQWQSFPISRKGVNPGREIMSVIGLKRVFQEIKPDVVFLFTPKCVLYGSVVSKYLKIPTIVNTITGLGYLFSIPVTKYFWARAFVRLFYHISLANTKVIFQNPEDFQEFTDRKIIQSEEGFLVSGSGVDIERFVFTEETKEKPIVILPSRLIKEKGVYEFIAAARRLKLKNINARFILVGKSDEGNPSAILHQQIDQWVEEGVVEWWGWRSDMEKVYQQCHLVCYPSYYNEGTPKTLIEAAASGRAIITSDIPGCREVVRHHQNGLLVQPRNEKLLAAAIEKLILDSNLRKQMGQAGRTIVEKEFRQWLIVTNILTIAGLTSMTPADK